MAKQTGTLLLLVGGAALLMMGKKKKKKKGDGSPSGTGSGTGAVDPDTGLGEPTKPGGTTTTPGGGSTIPKVPKAPKVPATPKIPVAPPRVDPGAPPALEPGALWVSADCMTVAFGDESGELWWQQKGLPSAQEFVAANYIDPYEIAREMLLPIAPCVAEFPLIFEAETNAELQFGREFFLRTFPDVYYLMMTLYKQIAPLTGLDAFNLRFDEDCKVEFVGHEWLKMVAQWELLFYLDFAYPTGSDYDFVHGGAWLGSDLKEEHVEWLDNCILAVINRWSSECATAIMDAFKSGEIEHGSQWMGDGPRGAFFKNRPTLQKLYSDLFELGTRLDETRVGTLPFDLPDEVKGSS